MISLRDIFFLKKNSITTHLAYQIDIDRVKISRKVTIAKELNLRGSKFSFFLLGGQNRNIRKLREPKL